MVINLPADIALNGASLSADTIMATQNKYEFSYFCRLMIVNMYKPVYAARMNSTCTTQQVMTYHMRYGNDLSMRLWFAHTII